MGVTDYTIKVLDKGYVSLLSAAGPSGPADDCDPANCARVSFDARDTRTREDDLRLNRYLWKHRHTTPFEMVTTWWEIKLPIFVARQFVRHRTASINETSRRYVDDDPEIYYPDHWRPRAVDKKQGSSDEPLHHMVEASTGVAYFHATAIALAAYRKAIAAGVAPEMARMVLPVSAYTKWIWKQDLHNLLHMLKLRSAHDAQWETRQYADAMIALLRQRLPDLMDGAIWE